MAVGAWEFISFPWHHPILSCIVLVLFSPPFFPILVYFSPLLISTGLVAIALVSMNVQGSEDSSEDAMFTSAPPRSQAAVHMEIIQSKPAQESWLEWIRKLEEKVKAWVEDGSRLLNEENSQAGVINLNAIQRYVSSPLLGVIGLSGCTEALQRHISAPLLGAISGSTFYTECLGEDQKSLMLNGFTGDGHHAFSPRELPDASAPMTGKELEAFVSADFSQAPSSEDKVDETSNEGSTYSVSEAGEQSIIPVDSLHFSQEERVREASDLGVQPLSTSYEGVLVNAEEAEPVSILMREGSSPLSRFLEAQALLVARDESRLVEKSTNLMSLPVLEVRRVVKGLALPVSRNESAVQEWSSEVPSPILEEEVLPVLTDENVAESSPVSNEEVLTVHNEGSQLDVVVEESPSHHLDDSVTGIASVLSEKAIPICVPEILTEESRLPPFGEYVTEMPSVDEGEAVPVYVPTAPASDEHRVLSVNQDSGEGPIGGSDGSFNFVPSVRIHERLTVGVDEIRCRSPVSDHVPIVDESGAEVPIVVSAEGNSELTAVGPAAALQVCAGERSGPEAPASDGQPELFTMDHSVAETRMMKPESSAFASEEETSHDLFLVATGKLERELECPSIVVLQSVGGEADHSVSSDNRAIRGDVNFSERGGLSSIEPSENNCDVIGSLGSSTEAEKLIFVDESSKMSSAACNGRSINSAYLFAEIDTARKSNPAVVDEMVQPEKQVPEVGLGQKGSDAVLNENGDAWDIVSQSTGFLGTAEVPEVSLALKGSGENLNGNGDAWTIVSQSTELRETTEVLLSEWQTDPGQGVQAGYVSSNTVELQLLPCQTELESQSCKGDGNVPLGYPITENTPCTKALGVIEKTQSSTATAKGEEYDDFMDRYFALKRSMSISTRKQEEYERALLRSSEAAKAAEIGATPGEVTHMPSDPASESLVFPAKKKPVPHTNADSPVPLTNVDSPVPHTNADSPVPHTNAGVPESVEAMTARLQKKFTTNWAKEHAPTVKEETITTPAMTPEVAFSAPLSSVERDKYNEGTDSFMSPMRRVISAVRNAGKRDSAVNNGLSLTPEKRVLAGVLSKREKFASMRAKGFASSEDLGLGVDNSGWRITPSSENNVSPADVLESKDEPSTDRLLKDRLISPLKKVFSMEVNKIKKADVGAKGVFSPAKKVPSTLKSTPGKDHTPTDKLRGKFLRIFSNDASGEKKLGPGAEAEKPQSPGLASFTTFNSIGASVRRTAEAPLEQSLIENNFSLSGRQRAGEAYDELSRENRSPSHVTQSTRENGEMLDSESNQPFPGETLPARDIDTAESEQLPSTAMSSQVAAGTGEGDRLAAAARFKSPEKKFTLSWRKKRTKDETHSKSEDELPEKFVLPIKSFSSFSAMNARQDGDCSSDECRSPERRFFLPSFKRDPEFTSERIESPETKPSLSWWSRRKGNSEASSPQPAERTGNDAYAGGDTPYGKGAPSTAWLSRGHKYEAHARRLNPADEEAHRSPLQREEGSGSVCVNQVSPSKTVPSPRDSAAVSDGFTYLSKSFPTPGEDRVGRRNGNSIDAGSPATTFHKRRSSLGTIDIAEELRNSFNRSDLDVDYHTKERLRNSFGRSDLHVNNLYRSSESPSNVERLRSSLNRSDGDGNSLYRHWDSPSNAEIRITDKLKAPLEEVLSLLAAGENEPTTSAIAEESSSSEETCSSEGEWSTSEDEGEEDFPVAHTGREKPALPFFQNRKPPVIVSRRFA